MKFELLRLCQYIGIYNGLGVDSIEIDFRKCRYNTTIIRGDNGSGKSTIMNALSLFPDGNECFIPGREASKYILIRDDRFEYGIRFMHPVKANGERDTTKISIVRFNPNGSEQELNPNGNVSSYKDIIHELFGLDPNFEALSHLSSDNRGLADKKPAERKRFVNSIISSLEVYNGIYKTLSKQSSGYKSLLNSIIGKLNVLGDEQAATDRLSTIESQIADLESRKNQILYDVAEAQSKISILDPNNEIQDANRTINEEMKILQADLDRMATRKTQLEQIYDINTLSGYESILDSLENQKNSMSISIGIDNGQINTILDQIDKENTRMLEKTQKLDELQSDRTQAQIEEDIKSLEDKMHKIEEFAQYIQVSPGSMNKAEIEVAASSLKNICDMTHALYATSNTKMLDKLLNDYKNSPDVLPVPMNRIEQKDLIERLKNDIDIRDRKIADILSKDKLYQQAIDNRPAECKIDSCPFIQGALEFYSGDYTYLEKLNRECESFTKAYELAVQTQEEDDAYNELLNELSSILREIDKIRSILRKTPIGSDCDSPDFIFNIHNDSKIYDYTNKLYDAIVYADQFELYNQYESLVSKYKLELEEFKNKDDLVRVISDDIARINTHLNELNDSLDMVRFQMEDKRKDMLAIDTSISGLQELIDLIYQYGDIQDKIAKDDEILSKNEAYTRIINQCLSTINDRSTELKSLENPLLSLTKERDSIKHAIAMINDYKKEKSELEGNYNLIETLKYYSSPTTGIQLVFMNLYMGNVINMANQLLSLLFKGEYVIQPFIINESEFRIPCLGYGYLNDDISSMSSAQISMISMILSFSLLYNSSSKYNIIKLDEIDGPLDYENRVYFMSVLHQIMTIMNTEQCIMISHNSELDVDNCDVIVLKHDENNPDYRRGNVIFSA